MDSKLMKTFVAVANHSSFTGAAKELYIAQSAVSKQIAQLEKDLDVQLFHRDTRMVRLTPTGEMFYRASVDILDRMESAIDALKDASDSGQGILSAGAFSVLSGEIIRLMRKFSSKYPFVEVSLDWYEFGDLVRRVEDGTLDIGFTIAFAVSDKTQLRSKSIERGRMSVMVGSNSPLAGCKELSLKDLSNRPYFTMRPDVTPDGYMNIMRFFSDNNFVPNHIQQYTSHESSILQLQLHDEAFGLMGEYEYRNHPGIVFIPLVEQAQPDNDCFDLVAVWRAKNQNSYISKLLAEID